MVIKAEDEIYMDRFNLLVESVRDVPFMKLARIFSIPLHTAYRIKYRKSAVPIASVLMIEKYFELKRGDFIHGGKWEEDLKEKINNRPIYK